jgi:hypothetical protein
MGYDFDALPAWEQQGGTRDDNEMGQDVSSGLRWPSILEEMATSPLKVDHQHSLEQPATETSIFLEPEGSTHPTETRGNACGETLTGVYRYSKKV